MTYKKVILTLLVTMMVGISSFAYADQPRVNDVQNGNQNNGQSPQISQQKNQQESLAELYHKAGLDKPEVIMNTLVSLGISNEELKKAISQGKKVFEMLQENEITLEAFKDALSKEYTIRIKQAIKDEVITKKEARTLTKMLKQRMNEWEV